MEEKMKINSKTGYNRARIRSGYGPHRLLRMIQEKSLSGSSETEDIEEVIE